MPSTMCNTMRNTMRNLKHTQWLAEVGPSL